MIKAQKMVAPSRLSLEVSAAYEQSAASRLRYKDKILRPGGRTEPVWAPFKFDSEVFQLARKLDLRSDCVSYICS